MFFALTNVNSLGLNLNISDFFPNLPYKLEQKLSWNLVTGNCSILYRRLQVQLGTVQVTKGLEVVGDILDKR